MSAYNHDGRHDPAARRRLKRTGKERGGWLYLTAEQLRTAGYDPAGPAPFYRTWANTGGRTVVQLYKAK